MWICWNIIKSIPKNNFYSEGILRQVFGITHTRYVASKMQNDAFDNLVDTIDEAFAGTDYLEITFYMFFSFKFYSAEIMPDFANFYFLIQFTLYKYDKNTAQ